MKVLFALTYYAPHWTGLTEHAKRLAEGLATLRHDVCVVATRHDSKLPFVEDLNGVNVVRTPVWFKLSRTTISPKFILEVYKKLKAYDCIVVYTPIAEALILAIVSKLIGKPLIIIHNGDLILPKGIFNRILELTFDITTFFAGKLASGIISYSDDYRDHSRFLRHFKNKSQSILPLFPNIPASKNNRLTATEKIIASHKPIIGFAGRFVEEKGFDILLRSMPLVIEQYPNAQFVFAGDTNIAYEHFYESQRKLMEKLGGKVISLGKLNQTEMRKFYHLLDVFVLPSRSDCLAFVQVEAMLSGVPVVVTNIPGARIAVKKTGMGIMVDPEDIQDLARGIIDCYVKKKTLVKSIINVHKMFDYKSTLITYETYISKSVLGKSYEK